jgi:hypothetical protein
MTDRLNLEERLEAMAARLERVEKVNRLMKVWGTIAIAALIASGPLASTVMAKKVKPPPAQVVAQKFELETATGAPLAVLGVSSGNPGLVFLDSSGKTVLTMGVAGAGEGAGVAVYDDNAAIPGGSGKVRALFGVNPPLNAEGAATYTVSGALQSSVGSAEDATFSGAFFYDASGGLRSGVEYDPAASINFSGVFSQDGSGHSLSALGSAIAASTPLSEQANQSFMSLSDTSLPRIYEFQNSTNQGGVDYDPGDFPTPDKGWGNP